MHFTLENEYITLSQLLKACDVLPSGGMVKAYLADHYVLVNGEKENRRGRKLYANDVVEIDDKRISLEKSMPSCFVRMICFYFNNRHVLGVVLLIWNS